MVFSYNFDKFKVGMKIPTLSNTKLIDEFQILNFSMSSFLTPTIEEVDNIFTLKQVHGIDIVLIENGKVFHKDSVIDFSYSLTHSLEADAIITTDKEVKIGIRSADCAPIMFYGNGVVGGIHGGWRGLKSGIIENTIHKAKEKYNFDPSEGIYILFPCIHSCCYEVGREFLDWAKEHCLVRADKVFFDIPKFVYSKLLEIDAKEDNIYYSPLCTSCYSSVLPSFRATKTDQRIESFIYLT